MRRACKLDEVFRVGLQMYFLSLARSGFLWMPLIIVRVLRRDSDLIIVQGV